MHSITNAKCQNHGNKLRITFDWPVDLNQVYINDKLFTLQEYKKQGGFFARKEFGDNIFVISPAQNSEEFCTLIHTEKAVINCTITPKSGFGYSRLYSSYQLIFESNYPVAENIVQYSVGQYTYKISGKICDKQTCIIRAEEAPHVSVSDTSKYELVILH